MAVIALSVLLVLCLPATAQRSNGMEETVRMVVGRNGHHPWVNHTNFVYLVDERFSPVFDKAFLKQVYLLQERVENLKSEGERVTLRNICVKNNYTCIVESLWSYFQDGIANIDRKAMDASGFFIGADYLDHLQACFRKPWVEDDETALHMSCLPKSAFITSPDHTLSNFPMKADWVYRNATQLAITFHLKVPEVGDSKVTSWLEALQFYLAHNASVDYPHISAYLEEPHRLTNRP